MGVAEKKKVMEVQVLQRSYLYNRLWRCLCNKIWVMDLFRIHCKEEKEKGNGKVKWWSPGIFDAKGQKWGKSIKMIYTTIIRFVTNRNQIYKEKRKHTKQDK